ncbi:bile acid:sodium symporter [Paenibacillus sp. LC231]|uniref:bile acid:sodium symporter family protein n=1 Tax=Paenibacillus sp. LC231 TaxID=1120679 RepID=UPI0008DCDB3C|nr:bile acid:sodium symporter [Paenibacillus sp. LC231]OIB04932.1 bile acid:sodium symporter [Paenibacillus sp. LC231]
MRSFGLAFASWFEKYTFLLIPGSLVLGWLLSDVLVDFVHWIPYLFGYITLVMALGCGIRHLQGVLKRPFAVILTLFLAHAAAPVLAYGLGSAVFGAHSDYTIGLLLFAIIPLGISSVMWVGSSGGSVPFILAVVVLDTILSPLVVPALMEMFIGDALVTWNASELILDLLTMVVLPTLIGVMLYEGSKGRVKDWSAPVAQPISKLFFMLVVMLNAAAIAPHAAGMKEEMLVVIPVVVTLIVICYLLGYFGSYAMLGPTQEMQITFTYASGMRNISLGMVLATTYFSPQASIPVVLGIMFQQPAATIIHALFHRRRTRAVSYPK